jgi:hypothetical protein
MLATMLNKFLNDFFNWGKKAGSIPENRETLFKFPVKPRSLMSGRPI